MTDYSTKPVKMGSENFLDIVNGKTPVLIVSTVKPGLSFEGVFNYWYADHFDFNPEGMSGSLENLNLSEWEIFPPEVPLDDLKGKILYVEKGGPILVFVGHGGIVGVIYKDGSGRYTDPGDFQAGLDNDFRDGYADLRARINDGTARIVGEMPQLPRGGDFRFKTS